MSPAEARDILFQVANKAINECGYPVEWPDVSGKPKTNGTWLRVVLRHADGRQVSLSDEIGQRRWQNTGVLFLQVFSPVGTAIVSGYDVAHALMNAYRTFQHSILWVTNPRMNEVGNSGAYEQINVSIDFNYDDVR